MKYIYSTPETAQDRFSTTLSILAHLPPIVWLVVIVAAALLYYLLRREKTALLIAASAGIYLVPFVMHGYKFL